MGPTFSELITHTYKAKEAIYNIFGYCKTRTLIEHNGDKDVVVIEAEFAGTGEEASELVRRFVSEWLINQESWVRNHLEVSVTFV